MSDLGQYLTSALIMNWDHPNSCPSGTAEIERQSLDQIPFACRGRTYVSAPA